MKIKISRYNLLIFLILNLTMSNMGITTITAVLTQPIIADHTIVNMVRYNQIPETAIIHSKNTLHIAYEHTSHGSQIPGGMAPLATYKEGLGGTVGLYSYNSTFLHDDAMASYAASAADLGYADWAEATRNYLEDPANVDCNVIMWSWCGQVDDYLGQTMIDHYLGPMSQLETDFPDVMFVYMTGHVEGLGIGGSVWLSNEQIRNHCKDNNKILFDFADIESYDPDGNYYGDKNVTDSCSWYNETHNGNWALDWQATHTEGVDWYDCVCAHSYALNGNLKAYAIWWLWAKLAGWSPTVSEGIAFAPIISVIAISIVLLILKKYRGK